MLAHFAMRLVFGISLMLCLMPRDKVPSAFFRILMLVLLGLSVLAMLAAPKSLPLVLSPADEWLVARQGGLAPIAAGLCFLGSIAWVAERRAGATKILVAILFMATLGLWSTTLNLIGSAGQVLVTSSPITLVAQIVSATTLGGAMTAMLLGHRYLTAPGMPLDPLIRLNQYLGGAVALRAVMSGWGLTLLSSQLDSSTHVTWLALRWLAGIIGPAIVVVMVRQILKYKNTQAATGVLFVGVILTFIGELTADLLFREVGVPL